MMKSPRPLKSAVRRYGGGDLQPLESLRVSDPDPGLRTIVSSVGGTYPPSLS